MDKQCKKCGEVKSLDAFYVHPGCRDGVRPECKACNLAEKARRHAQNPQPARDRTRKWQEDNPDRYRANLAKFIESGGKKIADRRSYLKRTYGISLEEYEAKLAEQGDVCAICKRPPHPDISLHVDHNHTTGELRGLLCFSCNVTVGHVREDSDHLRAIAQYLWEHDPERPVARAMILERLRQLPPPIWKQPA